jgi:hypothetical protein
MLLIALALVSQTTAPERPVGASANYQGCIRRAGSMIDHRDCLAEEVSRGWRDVENAALDSGVGLESQGLWRQLVELDCQGEYDLAGGSNSAPMRRAVCVIEMQAERTRYLLRRGNW